MCPKCQGFGRQLQVKHPHECYGLIRQIEQVVSEGTFASVAGNFKLADVRPGAPWPDDCIHHTFRCTNCSQTFRLAVETYHGSGGTWQPVGENSVT